MGATVLRFSGGETLRIHCDLADINNAFRMALKKGVMFELKAPDGRTLIINPFQVQYLQDAASEPLFTAARPQEAANE